MNIKNIGLDLFISFHPKVKQLKRESKELYKSLKNSGLSLMQCQELTAKNNGFSNWYHFTQTIKQFYEKEIEKIPFIITNTNIKPIDNKHNNTEQPILLGKDINFNHYLWQSKSSLRSHHMILGENVYNKYDLYLIKQAIQSNTPFMFLNGDGDIESLDYILSEYSKNNNQNSIGIFNFTNKSTYPEYEMKFLDDFQMSSQLLIDIFYKFVTSDNKNNEEYNKKVHNIISVVIQYLTHQRDEKNIILNLNTIKEVLNINQLSNILLKTKSSSNIFEPSFLENINLSNDSNHYNFLEEYSLIIKKISTIIDKLIDSKMFSNDGIPFENIFNHNYIFHFNHETKKENIFILNMIKSIIQINYDKLNLSLILVLIRNCYLPQGISCISAQARGFGISITFSYASLSQFINKNGYNEAEMTLANTYTKIFSINEQEQKTLRLLNQSKQEINTFNNHNILNNTINKISININMDLPKSDNIWVIKKGYCSQISFNL